MDKTIKTKIKSILKNDNIIDVEEVLNDAVYRMHNLTYKVYDFIKLYILWLYKENKESLPELDKDFIIQIFSLIGERDSRGRKSKKDNKSLLDFYNNEYSEIDKLTEKVSYSRLTYVIPYQAIEMETAYKNNIRLNYFSRLYKFIKKELKLDNKTQISYIRNDLLNFNKPYKSDSIHHEWIDTNRNNLIPEINNDELDIYFSQIKEKNKISKNMIQHPIYKLMNENLSIFLKKTIYMNIQLEKETNIKLFQPISRRSTFIPCYCTFDTNALIQLFGYKNETPKEKISKEDKEKNKEKKKNKKELEKTQREKNKENGIKNNLRFDYEKDKLYDIIWNKYFNLTKFQRKTRSYVFNNMIKTDGCAVSMATIKTECKGMVRTDMQIERRKKINKQKEDDRTMDEFIYLNKLDKIELDNLKNKKFVGVDPGKKNILFMIDENGKTLRYTVSQRRMETRSKLNTRIRKQIENKKVNKELQIKLLNLSKYNMKTCNYEKYKNNIKNSYKELDWLLNYYKKKIYRNLKFKSYVYTQKTDSNLIKKIKEYYKDGDKEIILLYGNWSRKSQMKYSHPTPNIGLKRKINREIKIYSIDEYKTSCLCNKCKNPTKNKIKVLSKKNTTKKVLQHSLLSCTSKECNELWSRDVNGSLNILEIGISIIKGNGIPKCYRRTELQ